MQIIKTLARLQYRGFILAGLLVGGCATGGYVPPEAINPPAKAFNEAIHAFSQEVEKNELVTYRREVRRDLYVAMVRDLVRTENWTDEDIKEVLKSQTAVGFLCRPRYSYHRVAVRLGNIEAISGVLGDRLQAPSDDITKLIASVSANYSMRIVEKEAPPTYDAWRVTDAGKKCLDTVASGDPFATRDYIGREFGIAALSAGKAVIDTIWSVVKPVFVSGLQNRDLERRSAAVREFFADNDKVAALRSDIENTEIYLQKEFTLSQVRTAGQANVAALVLFDSASPLWVKIKAIALSNACKQALQARGGASSARGNSCMNDVLAATSPELETALRTADAFDVSMDRQLPAEGERLSKQLDTLQNIALGKQTDEEKAKALWAAAVRYVALFQTAKDAASDANQKKIVDAWAAFLKALK